MKKPSFHRAARWLLLAGLAACTPLSQTVVVAEGGPDDDPDGPPVPTPDGFGVGYRGDPPGDWKQYGDLLCESEKRESCVVAKMPLLAQTDHRLVAPLTAHVKKYANAQGEVKVLSGGQIKPVTVDHAVHGTLNNGCWMTSQTTLIQTAIANKPGLPLTGRAVAFAGVGADPALDLLKPQHQLLWQYIHETDWVEGQAKHTQPPPLNYVSLREFAGDLAAAGVKMGSLGRTRLESPAIVAALQKGELLAFAYGRYQVNIGAPGKDGRRPLTFTRASQHKVAVSGFRPGTYPVVINDVGDGKRHHVRVTANWRSLKYTSKDSAGTVTTVDASKLDIDPKFDGRSFVAYEGAEEITLDEPHGRVFFLDDCVTLSVP
jgi:hypothetical protein